MREALARDELTHAGAEVFCPFSMITRRKKVRMSSRYRVVTSVDPLFPRYVFARDLDLGRARNVRGVVDLVRAGNVPLAVPSRIMDLIMSRADADGIVEKVDHTKFPHKVGDSFQFKAGVLSGLVGRIASLDGLKDHDTVKAWVSIFGRETSFNVQARLVGDIVQAA